MKLQFVLIIYYLTLVRKSLVSVHALIYLHSNIYFRNFSLNFEASCGSYLYKGTLTFILLPLFNCDLSYEMSSSRSLLLKSFHTKCPDPSHFITSQLQPFHAECRDPGHSTKNCVRDGDRMRQLIIYCFRRIVDLVVLLVYYSGCVDRSGSLSGGAFNQLRLVTLNMVITILY